MARPRVIDRAAVLAASLDIADEEGLDAVTMASVAARLGVTPMALYRHVENKQDLLDGVVESLLAEVGPPDEELPWDERLAQMGRAVRNMAHRHPHVFPLLLQMPATTPMARQARDAVVDALRDAGVADRESEQLERVVSSLVLGFAASEVGGRFRAHPRSVVDADYEVLESFIRAGLAPHLA